MIILAVLVAAGGLAGLTKWAFDRRDSRMDNDQD
jgi:hypothetical protein